MRACKGLSKTRCTENKGDCVYVNGKSRKYCRARSGKSTAESFEKLMKNLVEQLNTIHKLKQNYCDGLSTEDAAHIDEKIDVYERLIVGGKKTLNSGERVSVPGISSIIQPTVDKNRANACRKISDGKECEENLFCTWENGECYALPEILKRLKSRKKRTQKSTQTMVKKLHQKANEVYDDVLKFMVEKCRKAIVNDPKIRPMIRFSVNNEYSCNGVGIPPNVLAWLVKTDTNVKNKSVLCNVTDMTSSLANMAMGAVSDYGNLASKGYEWMGGSRGFAVGTTLSDGYAVHIVQGNWVGIAQLDEDDKKLSKAPKTYWNMFASIMSMATTFAVRVFQVVLNSFLYMLKFLAQHYASIAIVLASVLGTIYFIYAIGITAAAVASVISSNVANVVPTTSFDSGVINSIGTDVEREMAAVNNAVPIEVNDMDAVGNAHEGAQNLTSYLKPMVHTYAKGASEIFEKNPDSHFTSICKANAYNISQQCALSGDTTESVSWWDWLGGTNASNASNEESATELPTSEPTNESAASWWNWMRNSSSTTTDTPIPKEMEQESMPEESQPVTVEDPVQSAGVASSLLESTGIMLKGYLKNKIYRGIVGNGVLVLGGMVCPAAAAPLWASQKAMQMYDLYVVGSALYRSNLTDAVSGVTSSVAMGTAAANAASSGAAANAASSAADAASYMAPTVERLPKVAMEIANAIKK